ncbi:unnamed protein product [marine sediment metagenome]|uniref:Uncharacterized protein n=1 Tax=marine sediment metagenome TaxID=412755 RepID=X1RH63_9ZZZZ
MGKAKRNRGLKKSRVRIIRNKDENSRLDIPVEPFCYAEGCYCYGFMADVMRDPGGEMAKFLGIDRKA